VLITLQLVAHLFVLRKIAKDWGRVVVQCMWVDEWAGFFLKRESNKRKWFYMPLMFLSHLSF
jgi:hypothetical protein